MQLKVILYSNEVIPEKLRVDKYLYSQKDDVRIAFIPLIVEEDTKIKHYKIVQHYYGSIGIKSVDYFDLTKNSTAEILDTIEQYEVFHFSGGNTLETMQYFKEQGLDKFFRKTARKEKIFIGHCGGAVLLSSNASWVRLRTEDIGDVLDKHSEYRALDLVNFEFLPHYNRFKKEQEFLQKVIEYSIGIKNPIYACNDGDGIIIDGHNLKCIGDLVEIAHGELYRT